MPRLGHKKSRNGCKQCKARHVKCDENKPCSSCARHNVQCSLLMQDLGNDISTRRASSSSDRSQKPPPGQVSGASAPSHTPSSSSLPIQLVLNPSPSSSVAPAAGNNIVPPTQDPFPYFAKFTKKTEFDETTHWIRDIELMHHWTTSTCFTLSEVKEHRMLWQVVIPKMAVRHTFLLHEMLALSAMHLTFLQPEQGRVYSMLATHHQDLGIGIMREMLPNVSSDNCDAVFVTSSLLTVNAFASGSLAGSFVEPNLQAPIDDLLDVFILIQGMYSIVSSSWNIIIGGPLAAMLQTGGASVSNLTMSELLQRIEEVTLLLDNKALGEHIQVSCLDAISGLRTAADLGSRAVESRELRAVFGWPITLSTNFMSLLRQRQPEALVILAYFCVMLHICDSRYWYMRGWSSKVANAVSKSLDPSWQAVIRWPMDFILHTPRNAPA